MNQSKTLSEEISHYKALRNDLMTVPGMDETCLLDTLEGATSIHQMLLLIDEEIQEREGHVIAIDSRIATLSERKERHKKAIETFRAVILRAMDSLDLKKIEGATATLTVTQPKPEVVIDAEHEIPSQFWIAQPPKLDKKKLSAALSQGPIDGCRLGNGRINLQIRRK